MTITYTKPASSSVTTSVICPHCGKRSSLTLDGWVPLDSIPDPQPTRGAPLT